MRTSLSRTIRATLTLLGVFASASPAAAQQPFNIGFSAFRSPVTTEYQATPGGDVYEAGFAIVAAYGTGARNALGTWGVNDPTRPDLMANVPRNLGPTKAAMWGTAFGERMDMYREDGYLFNLTSIDLAHMFARSYLLSGTLAPLSITFFGFDATGVNTPALQQTFSVPVPSVVGGDITPELNTYAFNSNFQSLSQVAWFQRSGNSTGSAISHQFTNIQGIALVPEPGTYLLVGSGLFAIVLIGRRRRVV